MDQQTGSLPLSEVIGRRYFAFRGEDPNALIDGRPCWQLALEDVRISVNVLETFQIDTGLDALLAARSVERATQLHLALPEPNVGLRLCHKAT